jgi:hypothetical protein
MSHGQIRTPVAIKLLNLLIFTARIDVVAAPSPATKEIKHLADILSLQDWIPEG